jgi:uncharacterized membrane protein
MPPKLQNAWENLKASLWFVPALAVLGAILLAQLLLRLDARFGSRIYALLPWYVADNADAARAILAVISGSLVTVISIAYSITILAIQQTSALFSPRVLRALTSDRGNQVVLGAYMGTFVYSLLIMRQIRDVTDTGSGFVPPLALTIALGLALICLAMLIYFLDHIAHLLQVSVIIANVHRELNAECDRMFPSAGQATLTEPATDLASEGLAPLDDAAGDIRAASCGFLRLIDERLLIEATDGRTPWLRIIPQVGDYVPHEGILVQFPLDARLDHKHSAAIRDAFVLDVERTMNQDPLLGIRQLVDIALKALSPAINDPTTAEYCLARLGDTLCRLCQRPLPSNVRVGIAGGTRYIFNLPVWDEFVDTAFSQIRRQAADDVHVTSYLLRVLYQIAMCLPPDQRVQALQYQLREIDHVLSHSDFSPGDAAMLRRQVTLVEAALAEQPHPGQLPLRQTKLP